MGIMSVVMSDFTKKISSVIAITLIVIVAPKDYVAVSAAAFLLPTETIYCTYTPNAFKRILTLRSAMWPIQLVIRHKRSDTILKASELTVCGRLSEVVFDGKTI